MVQLGGTRHLTEVDELRTSVEASSATMIRLTRVLVCLTVMVVLLTVAIVALTIVMVVDAL
jgi:hypothetical protein